ncbi:dienelactone hydrolase endo-1,3,1,4-beta-D-glucanase [Gymnopus androsaceus JB14]|uniref:Dienelactone hydrolase endo-1,3,1,4-beta-D-glucanase n=1 Tax=Gymnopus androsaceus JB14 TaxID=1447944 RepID=A0A6A4HTD1_9AGAR|nr:dienelactone hydrolase endo-1,3,1,4-beta-D-glucanase [Gymnopus androsaceus JB14]
MSLCENCVRGVTHEATPSGTWEEINGVNCYIATPSSEYPKEKVLLLLSDLFGPQLVNTQLLGDGFAANGFKTIIPDYFNGDGAPADALSSGSTFDRMEWLKRHGPENTRPPLDKVVQGLKAKGVTSFGILGYCFGGRYAFDLAFDGVPKVVMVAHPAMLKSPEDLEMYFTKSSAPLLINSCTDDALFPHEAQAKADEIFEGKFAPGYKREYWKDVSHGFASRGDVTIPVVKAAKEGAFKSSVEWMKEYL